MIQTTWWTRVWTAISVLLWAGLSIFVTTIPDKRAWLLLLIGGLGSLQNLIAAQMPRQLENLGLDLDAAYKVRVVRHRKVMQALLSLEDVISGAGARLVDLFFAKGITAEEKAEWIREGKVF